MTNKSVKAAKDTAVASLVQTLQVQFSEWTLRREIKDRLRVKSILTAWGFYEGAKWKN